MFAVPPRLPEGSWALFLDVDGTILELADTPDRVTVSGRVLAILESARAASDGALALVSGRSIRDLDVLFSPLVLPASGLHGAEHRNASGLVSIPSFDARLQSAAADLEQWCTRHPGTLLENKGAALALHYRLAPQAEPPAREVMRRILRLLAPDFVLQEGKCVLELRPSGVSKATAIEAFLNQPPFRGRTPVFLGDDLTDESGFRAVRAWGGQAITVGKRGDTAAQWSLPNVGAVLTWLSDYARSRRDSRGECTGSEARA